MGWLSDDTHPQEGQSRLLWQLARNKLTRHGWKGGSMNSTGQTTASCWRRIAWITTWLLEGTWMLGHDFCCPPTCREVMGVPGWNVLHLCQPQEGLSKVQPQCRGGSLIWVTVHWWWQRPLMPSWKRLTLMLSTIQEYINVAANLSMIVSLPKMKFMVVENWVPIPVGEEEEINNVSQFAFLGSVIHSSGRAEPDVNKRIAQAWWALASLHKNAGPFQARFWRLNSFHHRCTYSKHSGRLEHSAHNISWSQTTLGRPWKGDWQGHLTPTSIVWSSSPDVKWTDSPKSASLASPALVEVLSNDGEILSTRIWWTWMTKRDT